MSQDMDLVTSWTGYLPGDAASETSQVKEVTMTEKKVPEDQLAFLFSKLLGNQSFGRLRGSFSEGLGSLKTILEAAESPTDFCQRWDRFCGDARVMGNLLACFQRDGWDAAEQELTRALQDATYRMSGEEVPLHETEPVTIVIFDFKRTLTFIRWVRCAHFSSLNAYLDEIDYLVSVGAEWSDENPAEGSHLKDRDRVLTRKLFEAFPELEQYARDRRAGDHYEGRDLVEAYFKQVLDLFEQVELNEIGQPLCLAWNTYNDHLELYRGVGNSLHYGYICRTDQAEVLSQFSRDQQKNIATWCVQLPKAMTDTQLKRMFLVFHPEAEHDKWISDSANVVSTSLSHGYGVVAMSRIFADPLDDHTNAHHDRYSLARVYLKDASDPLAFELETR
jgi:hypothetical protein